MRARDIRIFLLELGTLYRSGIPIQEGLDSLADSRHRPVAHVARELSGHIRRGSTLAEALRREEFLPPEYVAIIDAGERSGQVPELLLELGNELERREKMQGKLIGRLLYPAALYALACLLPPIHSLIGGDVGSYLLVQVYGFGPVLVAGALFVVLRRKFRENEAVRRTLEGPLLALPVVSRIWIQLALGRSLGLLGLLIQSGISLREGFQYVERSAFFHRLATGFNRAADVVEHGGTLADAMLHVKEIPDLQHQQIATGERSGTMDAALQRCGTELTESAFARLDGVLRLLPIALYLFVAVLIARKYMSVLGGGM